MLQKRIPFVLSGCANEAGTGLLRILAADTHPEAGRVQTGHPRFPRFQGFNAVAEVLSEFIAGAARLLIHHLPREMLGISTH